MARHIIFQHEDWQTDALRDFLAPLWVKWQGSPIPPFDQNQGTVNATINQGRWIAECPAGCGNAIVVSQAFPYYICVDCGSDENDGNWYNVIFPRTKKAIETELLKRSAKKPFWADTRNWTTESLATLREENRVLGV